MRLRGLGLLWASLFVAACAGDDARSLTNNTKPNLENPNLVLGSDALTIILTAHVLDDGTQSYELSASLIDQIKGRSDVWSNPSILGPQFKFSLGPLLDVPMVFSTSSNKFELLEPIEITSGSFFRNLHDQDLVITKIDSPNQNLSGSLKSPLVLAPYPILGIPQLSNRILSNCAPDTQQPDIITWTNQGYNPIKINFYTPPTTLKLPVEVLDSTQWQLNMNVFNAFYTPSEIDLLETPIGGAYGYDTKDIRMNIVRKMTGNFSVGSFTLPVQILVVHDANYLLEYQGGCQP